MDSWSSTCARLHTGCWSNTWAKKPCRSLPFMQTANARAVGHDRYQDILESGHLCTADLSCTL